MMDLNKQAEEIVDWCRAYDSEGDGYRESGKEAEEYVAAALARVQADERERCCLEIAMFRNGMMMLPVTNDTQRSVIEFVEQAFISIETLVREPLNNAQPQPASQ